MHSKKIVKKFKAKGCILRPQSLAFVQEHLPRLHSVRVQSHSGHSIESSLAFLAEACQAHFREHASPSRIVEPVDLEAVFNACLDQLGSGLGAALPESDRRP